MASVLAEELARADLLKLGFEAARVRREVLPEATVGYSTAALLRVGPCPVDCRLCQIYGERGGAIGRVGEEQALARVEDFAKRGVREVVLHGEIAVGLNAAVELVRSLARVAAVHGFSAHDLAAVAAEDVSVAIAQLATAGLGSLFLSEWQTPAPRAMHRAAAAAGLRTAAVLDCSDLERLPELCVELTEAQKDSGNAIAAVIVWPSAPEFTAVDYLKAVALARTLIRNVDHIQVGWAALGIKTAQATLQFGADDLGNAAVAEGTKTIEGTVPSEEELRRLIRDAGYMPVRRDVSYASYYR
jgi:cyclic dehypoxanthinyl futalosine synthase